MEDQAKLKARRNNSVLQALRKEIKSCRALVSWDRASHQVGAITEKALALVEENLASLGPCRRNGWAQVEEAGRSLQLPMFSVVVMASVNARKCENMSISFLSPFF